MRIVVVTGKMNKDELKKLAAEGYKEMVKGVTDLNKGILALGGELHADAEAVLLEGGSRQEDLWGFNIYIDKPAKDRVEFTSFINIRPSQGNRSMEVKDRKIRDKIAKLIDTLVENDD